MMLARTFKSLESRSTKLLNAAKIGDEASLKDALANPKVMPDFQDHADGATALLHACENGHGGCAKLLIEAKAYINAPNSSGMYA